MGSLERSRSIAASAAGDLPEETTVILKESAGARHAQASGQPAAVRDGTFSIGRDAANDIVVEDSSVSRHHAEIRVDGDGMVLIDLDSMNGTHVREEGRWIEIARASVTASEPLLLGEVVMTPQALLNRLGPAASGASRPAGPHRASGGNPAAVRSYRRNKAAARQNGKPLETRTATGRPLDQRAPAPATRARDDGTRAVGSSRSHNFTADAVFGKPEAHVQDSKARNERRRRDTAARNRIIAAAIFALVLISGGITAVGWALT